jgi:hypothetical protein
MGLISECFRPITDLSEKRPFKRTGKFSFLVTVFKNPEGEKS